MALSQLQCLDDSNVNPRTNEAKPEFLYCEDQRLALEALLAGGREAFFKCLDVRSLRGFLSELELEQLTAAAAPYDPGEDLFPDDAEEDEPPLSLHYWPDLSDTSVPEMDLGWPDTEAYRGVTRTTIHSQPPLDGQLHVKEVVRKMIAQAQKVIAVVMDAFTDVDIFRDLLDAGYRRKVSVYILLERTMLPHFLSMCQRARMHAGHLKHLRVRCTGGMQFHTRSSTVVSGRMGHRFMFIDGDKAVSGSYSFTWMSSRLDRNLVTVISGQAVEAFDRLFRTLYATSTSVSLRPVVSEPEPEPDPVPQPVTVVLPSASVARKLYSPKYALALGSTSANSIPPPSTEPITLKKSGSEQNPENPEGQPPRKRGRRKTGKEPMQEAPPLHPGLCNLEKAHLISYLPIWPEPDPPKDVIGFINIRDSNKPTAVHLQRSEMFEVSQAIRFKSPVNAATDTLADVAEPKQFTVEMEKVDKRPQDKTGQSLPDVWFGNTDSDTKEPEEDIKLKCQSVKSSVNTDELQSDTTSSQNANGSSGSLFNEHSSYPTVPVLPTKDLEKNQTGRRASANLEDAQIQLPAKSLNPQVALRKSLFEMARSTENLAAITSRSPLHKTTVNSQPVASASPTFQSVNAAVTANRIPALSPNRSSSSTNLASNRPSPSSSSSSLSSAPPVPKPRTVQLFIKDDPIHKDLGRLEPNSILAARSPTNSVQQSKIGSEDKVNLKTFLEALKPVQSRSSKEPQANEGQKLNQSSKSGVIIADTAKAQNKNLPAQSPKHNSDTLTPIDCKSATTSMQKESKSFDFPKTVPENNRLVTQHKTFFLSAQNPQRILYSSSTTTKDDELRSPKSLKATPDLHTNSDKQTGTGHAKEKSELPALRRLDSYKNTTNAQLGTTEHQATSVHDPEKWASAQPLTKDKKEPFSPVRETQLLSPVKTPDSFPRTPDQRSFTPDFRTPTSDISDGYISALSTASDEFFECSNSPLRDNVFDPLDGAKDGTAGLVFASSPSSTTKSLSCVQSNPPKSVSRLASGSSPLTPLGENDKKEAFDINDKIWREMDAIALKAKVPDKRVEEDFRKSKTTLDSLRQGKTLAESKSTGAQLQGSMRRTRLSDAKADKGGPSGAPTSQKAEPRRSTGDPRLRRAPSFGERLDKVSSRSSSLERKGRSLTATDGQKPSLTPPRSPRGQRQEGGTASASKPPRPWGRPTVLSDGRGPHQDRSSTPHRPATRLPPSTSSPSMGRKQQTDTSHGQQSPAPRQRPASPGRRATQTANHSKPGAPVPSQASPPHKNQSAAESAEDQEESKSQFSMYLKMYNFMTLKDKMTKLPSNGKKGGESSTQAHKSSS